MSAPRAQADRRLRPYQSILLPLSWLALESERRKCFRPGARGLGRGAESRQYPAEAGAVRQLGRMGLDQHGSGLRAFARLSQASLADAGCVRAGQDALRLAAVALFPLQLEVGDGRLHRKLSCRRLASAADARRTRRSLLEPRPGPAQLARRRRSAWR